MSLKEYVRKRQFDKTPEPRPRKKAPKKVKELRYVIQKHDASRIHYDFRLEIDGAYKSWAVPKGPTLTSGDPRLAVFVEDHPLEYGDFEGTIPKGNYGAGTVMIWDRGTYLERGSADAASSLVALREGMAKGHLTFVLNGEKLKGEFALVKIKKKNAPEKGWLLIKKHDAEASRRDVLKEDRSAVSERSMEEIAAQSEKKGDVWLPGKGRQKQGKAKSKVVPPKKIVASPKKTVGIKKKKMSGEIPRRVRPMVPIFGRTLPDDKNWIFESFAQGVRAIAEVTPAGTKLYSRSFLPFEKKNPEIVAALKKIGHEAVFDGEIVKEVYRISDLLFIDGKDLRETPLHERKKLLTKIKLAAPLELNPFGATPKDLAGPTLVAKRADSHYLSGLTKDWLRFRVGADRTVRASQIDRPPITHPSKIFWPKEGYTKGDLVNYYEQIADLILPYLIDRPQSLHRQPDGLRNEGFFHKDMSSFLPRRIETVRIYSESSQKTINYALCQDRYSLLYLVNLGCIELNPWLSRKNNLDKPDLVVIDVDPNGNDFKKVIEIAREIHKVLEAIDCTSYCKTSGSTGLHVCIPTGGRYDYDTGRAFAEAVCRIVHQRLPAITSMERNPAKRGGRVYLDCLQNRRSQTLAAPYCVRPKPKATVSTPLRWSEVKTGLKLDAFTIKTLPQRVKKVGDLWKPLLTEQVDLEACLAKLLKKFHI